MKHNPKVNSGTVEVMRFRRAKALALRMPRSSSEGAYKRKLKRWYRLRAKVEPVLELRSLYLREAR